MSQKKSLVTIGSEVVVDLSQVKDRMPGQLRSILNKDRSGIVVGYKMTDGMGIGFILKLKDGSQSWFFNEEVEVGTEKFNKETNKAFIERDDDFIGISQENSKSKGIKDKWIEDNSINSQRILYLINPYNFFEWLFHSLKDVF